MTQRKITLEKQQWPLKNEFRISRGSRTLAEVIQVTICEEGKCGLAESVPYARYGESIDSVIEQVGSVTSELENGISNKELNQLLSAGAARNVLDCALWDLQAKKTGICVHELLNLQPFTGALTAQTLSIDGVEEMAEAASLLKNYPLIKVKLDDELVLERMKAVASAAPDSRFIIDANEAWQFQDLTKYAEKLEQLNVVLIEQPLPASKDNELKDYQSPVLLCADESVHTAKDLQQIKHYYQAINIKLDKTGGLTEAIKVLHQAKELSLTVMVGCMVGTSLAMAPASLLASYADFVDLDGPALLARDKSSGFRYKDGQMSALDPALWGGPI